MKLLQDLPGKTGSDGILLKMPVMKELLIKGAVAIFLNPSTMISSGIDLSLVWRLPPDFRQLHHRGRHHGDLNMVTRDGV